MLELLKTMEPEVPVDTVSKDTTAKDTAVGDTTKHDSIPDFVRGVCALPGIAMHVSGNRLVVTGAPAGARVRILDVQGNQLGVLGMQGGALPQVRAGRVLAIVESASGKRLLTKAFSVTEF